MSPARHGFHPAFVVPRYGEEIIGGAETLARATAEELVRSGHPVTVLTTCALDHYTWKNHYPPGTTQVNDVEVIRFPAQTDLADPGLAEAARLVASGAQVSAKQQRRWIEGVVRSEGLFEHIREEGRSYSHLIFLPHLYGTTFIGSKIHPERSYIIPCLHDEPYARQPVVKEMLLGVKGLIFNSPGEKKLAARLLGRRDPGAVAGMGFRPRQGDPAAFRDRTPVRGDFVLYAGRREDGKNTPMLVEYFRRMQVERPVRLSLVLMGVGDVEVPGDSTHLVFDLGRVSEREKWDGYSAAFVFCQPSVNESLSIVLLESWLAGVPALVNRGCEVTSEHVRLSGGGLCFDGFPEFSEAVRALLENRESASRLGQAGRRYVEEQYNWGTVLARLFDALGVDNE